MASLSREPAEHHAAASAAARQQREPPGRASGSQASSTFSTPRLKRLPSSWARPGASPEVLTDSDEEHEWEESNVGDAWYSISAKQILDSYKHKHKHRHRQQQRHSRGQGKHGSMPRQDASSASSSRDAWRLRRNSGDAPGSSPVSRESRTVMSIRQQVKAEIAEMRQQVLSSSSAATTAAQQASVMQPPRQQQASDGGTRAIHSLLTAPPAYKALQHKQQQATANVAAPSASASPEPDSILHDQLDEQDVEQQEQQQQQHEAGHTGTPLRAAHSRPQSPDQTGATASKYQSDVNMSAMQLAEVPSLNCKAGTGDSVALSHNLISCCSIVQLKKLGSSVKSLNISHNLLTELPEDLGLVMMSLTELNLSYNGISALPDSICQVACLRHLSLKGNKLQQLPAGLELLSTLRSLDASHNSIVALPEGLLRLQALESLSLQHNELSSLPDALARPLSRASSSSTTSLMQASAQQDSNPAAAARAAAIIADGPAGAAAGGGDEQSRSRPASPGSALGMSTGRSGSRMDSRAVLGLQRLASLDLGSNKLTYISPQLLAQLSQLTYLNLSGNRLSEHNQQADQQSDVMQERSSLRRSARGVVADASTSSVIKSPRQGALIRWASFNTSSPAAGSLRWLSVGLHTLKELKVLNLSNNQLPAVPELLPEQLEVLYMSGNLVAAVPRELQQQLPSLQVLGIGS